MKLNQQKILAILKGDLVPPPTEIGSINDRMWKYYRKLKWLTCTGRWASREHCGGLSLRVPYQYLPRVCEEGFTYGWRVTPDAQTYTLLTVNLCPQYGGDALILLQLDVPEFMKDIIRLYINAGWCDAVPLKSDRPRPMPGDVVLGGGLKPKPDDAVLGGTT